MTETSGPDTAAKTPARTPRWFKVLFVLAILFWLAGVTIPYFLNVDRYRAGISSLISQQTGRQVTLGMIRARILPQVGFDVAGFHMSNPPGFVTGEFVSAEHVRGTLAFWPLLLHRQLRLTSLELSSPKLALLQNSRRENNYTFPVNTPAKPADSMTTLPRFTRADYIQSDFAAASSQQNDPPSDDLPPVSSVLQVDELILRDATVLYGGVDAAGRTIPVVQSAGFSATLRHMQLQPLVVRDWQADGDLSGARVMLATWNGPITFHNGNVKLRRGALESTFSVDFGKAARVDGTLSVPDVERAVVRFDLSTADVNVDQLVAGARAAKPAALAESSPESPSNSRALPSDVGAFDVGAGAPTEGTGAHAVLASSSRPARSGSSANSTLPNQAAPANIAISKLLAEGHLDAKKVRWSGYVAGPATADVRIYTDRLEMWPVTVRFAGGSLQATARTDSLRTPQRFAVNLEARNLNVEQILATTPSMRGKFAGTGELDLQVFGSLVSDWQRTLAGKGEFAVRNGRISGFNLSGAAQSIASLAGVNGYTTFTAITGDLDIGQERIASRDIHLDSSLGTLDLKGSLGLESAPDNSRNSSRNNSRNNSLDYSLNYDGQINAQIGGQSGSSAQASDKSGGNSIADQIGRVLAKNPIKVVVPFALRGTLQHPEILPGHGLLNFPPPAASHTTDKGLSYPNLFQQPAPATAPGSNSQ